jgi:1-acyl-sn-glycerol-3-phosphate acyltransferase
VWLTVLRSAIFVPIFYVTTALFVVLGSFLLLGPRRYAMMGLRAHAISCLWLLKWIVGTRMEVRGRDKLPKPPYLAACKHQSAWDTFALIPVFTDPAMVMKAELRHIPFHGWFSRKFEHVFVARERGPARCASSCATPGRGPPPAARWCSFPRVRGASRAPSPTTSRASLRSMRASSCRAFRSRSTPGSIGRAAA